MDDKAVRAGDAIEATLSGRIAEAYQKALERAVKNNRRFLTNVKQLDERAEKLKAQGWETKKIDAWRKEEMMRLLREQRVVQNIAEEMNRAGIEIAPEIKKRMADIYKINSDMMFSRLNDSTNINFTLVPRRQVEIILDDTQSVFSKLAYQHLGQNRVIRQRLQSELAQATLLGESQEKLIARLQKVTGMAEYQARRVAQTERTRVQSQARADALHEAAGMGITVTKRWSTRMVRSRDSHVALNGVEIPENEKFVTIWGNTLDYPGDPSAPAREVVNCHCVLVPDVKTSGANSDNRLKNSAENDIIDSEESAADPGKKANSIEKAFRYSDAWGDEYSPIDRASFASMPADAQQRAADGIRKAQELFKLDTLPQKIGFGDMRGAYGMYSETTRTLTLSRTRCKDPEEAFSTMIHELTHYYDHKSGHIAESVYKQALKEMGLRANSKQTYSLMRETIGLFNDTDIGDAHEIFAFGIEKAVSGRGNALAKKMLEIVLKGVK